MATIAKPIILRNVKLSADRSFVGYIGEYSDRRRVASGPAREKETGKIMPRYH